MRMATSEADLKALMLGSLDGDASAHGLLLRSLVPLLHAFFRGRLAYSEDVDDIVQDTLISVHSRRQTFDRDRPFTAWLYAIARHRVIDYYRQHRPTVAIEDFEAILFAEEGENRTAARLDVERLLATLSRKQARAIRDTHVEGKSVAEAAADAGIGVSDLKVSVHRGLRALGIRVRGSNQ